MDMYEPDKAKLSTTQTKLSFIEFSNTLSIFLNTLVLDLDEIYILGHR